MQKPGKEQCHAHADATLLQTELEMMQRHRHQKIRSLLQKIQDAHGCHLHTVGPETAQNLLAMLVVFRDEPTSDYDEQPDIEDSEWATRWLLRLRHLLLPSSTSSSSTGPATCVMVDTPPVSEHLVAAETEDESLRKAAALQREEDRIMAEALATPTRKSRRLLLNISLMAGNHSGFSRLSIPAPNRTVPVEMRLTLTTTGHQEDAEPGQDVASFMQTSRPGTRTLLDSLRPEVRRQVNRHVRRLLMARLQLLLRECHMIMREQQDLLAMAASEECQTEVTEVTEQEAELAHLYTANLHSHVQQFLEADDDVDPYDIVMQLAQGLDPQWPGRRHRLQPVEPEPTTNQGGTEAQTRALAQRLMDETDTLLFGRLGQGRADLLRDFVATLVGGLQTTGARLMTLLLLVGHYLPQPYAEAQASSQVRELGRNYGRDILDTIQRSFASNAAIELANGSFGIDEVAPLVPILSTMSLQCMTFLEDASYLLEDQSPASDHDSPLLLPDYMMTNASNPSHRSSTLRASTSEVPNTAEEIARSTPTTSTSCTPTRPTTSTPSTTAPTTLTSMGTARARGERGTSSRSSPTSTGSGLRDPLAPTSITPGTMAPTTLTSTGATNTRGARGTSSQSSTTNTGPGLSNNTRDVDDTTVANETVEGRVREPNATTGGTTTSPRTTGTRGSPRSKKRRSSPVPDAEGIRRFMSDS